MRHTLLRNPVFVLSTATALLLGGCGDDDDTSLPQLAAASGAPLANCATLASGFGFANTTIASAETVAAGTATWGGAPIAAHCLVKGEMYRRTSPQDGKSYAIGFEMRLPNDWNGRFFYQANGGIDGSVATALGGWRPGPQPPALQQGFAVISSDAGHTGSRDTELRHRLPGAAGLRLPGRGQAHADGQGADRRRLRQGPGPLVHRRLLQRRASHHGRDDAHARRIRRLPRRRPGLPPAAGGDRQHGRLPSSTRASPPTRRPRHGFTSARSARCCRQRWSPSATRSMAPPTG